MESLASPIARLATRLSSPRAQLATLTLLTVLQKSPALARFASSLKHSVEPATRILQKLALSAASLGSYHALSGATTAVYSTTPAAPFNFDSGETVTIAFGVSNTAASAQSWTVAGEIPPGLTVSGTQGAQLTAEGFFNNQFGQITGIPTQAGSYTLFLKPWKFQNGTGNTAEALELTITVTAQNIELVPPQARINQNELSVTVAWTAAPSQAYQLQTSNNPLDDSSWTPFPATIQTDGSQQTATLPKSTLPPNLVLRVASTQQN